MRCMTLLFAAVSVLLASPFVCWGSPDYIGPVDRIPADSGRRLGPTPDERLHDDLMRGFGGESFGERKGPWPPGQGISPTGGRARTPGGNIARARNDLDEKGPLFAALKRFGANPSPLGVARILDLMDQYPVEFWGLADRAREAARGGDPGARERLWRAVWVFREARVLDDRDWDDLGYVLARVNQGDGTGAAPKGKGDPIFHRPFDSIKGAPPPKGKGTGGGGSGDGTDGWFDGKGGPKSPIGDMGPVTDPKKWGKGKGGMGDGIMGWSDRDKGPPGFHWVPNVDIGLKPDFKGPKTMGPDGGFYGGINIGKLPGQAGKGKGKGWSEERRKKEHSKVCNDAMKDAQGKRDKAATDGEHKIWNEIATAWALWELGGEKNQTIWIATSDDGAWTFVSLKNGGRFLYNEEQGAYYDLNEETPQGSMPRPDGGGEGDSSPLRDPQLLLQMTKAADRQQNKPDVVPGVVDPVPIDKGGKAAGKGELAAAGAAKAEAAWKFSGKKPGSEVTDPAEWQTFGGEEKSGIAKDVSLITDPAEPLAGAVAMGETSSGMSEQGKALFALFMGQFLIQSVQAGAAP